MLVALLSSVVVNALLLVLYIQGKTKKTRITQNPELVLANDDIVVTKTLEKGRIKAFAAVKFNKSIVLKDIRIVADDENEKMLKIEMPSRSTKKGHLMEVYQIIDMDLRKKVFDMVLDKYKKL